MIRDERVERWIESHGGSFELKELPLSAIDRAKSARNQARFKPINDETILLYGAAMEQGDEFPPILVYVEKDSYVVVDGNHRVEAASLNDRPRIDAYVLHDPSEAMIRVLTFEANTKHGLPTTMAERLKQAVYLVEMGATHKDAAQTLHVPMGRLKNVMAQARSEKRLAVAAIPRWDRIGAFHKMRLDAIQSDVVFAEAAKLVLAAKMNSNDTGSLVTDINKQPNEAAMLARLAEERDRRKVDIRSTIGGRIQIPEVIQNLNRALAALDRFDHMDLKAATPSLSPDMRSALRRRCGESVERLRKAQTILR